MSSLICALWSVSKDWFGTYLKCRVVYTVGDFLLTNKVVDNMETLPTNLPSVISAGLIFIPAAPVLISEAITRSSWNVIQCAYSSWPAAVLLLSGKLSEGLPLQQIVLNTTEHLPNCCSNQAQLILTGILKPLGCKDKITASEFHLHNFLHKFLCPNKEKLRIVDV